MARKRKKAAEVFDGVPVELSAPSYEFWSNPAAVEQLALVCGIDPGELRDPIRENSGWQWRIVQGRLITFRKAWAQRNGFMNPRWPNTLDYAALRAAGVCTHHWPHGWPRRWAYMEDNN